MEQVKLEENRKVSRKKDFYNLDMIISIGFRVNSKTAIKFRKNLRSLFEKNMFTHTILGGMGCIIERAINKHKIRGVKWITKKNIKNI